MTFLLDPSHARPIGRPARRRRVDVAEPAWTLDAGINVVLFAGLGGACQGLEEAGLPVHLAVNHDPVAIAAHRALNPHTRHIKGDIFDVDPLTATGGRRVNVLWASPDCFVPGTLVLTNTGLRPIEDIRVGDLVLTHRGRWRPVVKAWTQISDTVEVRGYGHYGLVTTPGHRFYSKRITKRFDGKNSITGKRLGARRTLVENPYWPAAESMEGKLWTTPRAFPADAIPICTSVEFSDAFFYLFGRWLRDGSLNKGDVEICCGHAEAEEFRAILCDTPLRDADGEIIHFREVHRETTVAFVWGSAPLARWLAHEAGSLCESKVLPLWCLSMQRSWRTALLRGYLAADGYDSGRRTVVGSVSKALSLGIRLLATTLGHSASLFFDPGGFGSIEGRSFMGRDSFSVAWTTEPRNKTTFTDTLHRYFPVREVKAAGERLVVSLTVEEDESFVADGIVVHNCRDHSVAKGAAPRSARVRSLPWQVTRWMAKTRPDVVFIENVREIRGWGPLVALRDKATNRVLKLDGTVATPGERVPLREQRLVRDKRHLGRHFHRWVESIRALGYSFEDRDLCCADFGVPTSRRRYFAVARRDGSPARWPKRTHAPDGAAAFGLAPWRAASEIIDWTLPIPSIFERSRPLVAASKRRTAVGLKRFVLEASSPFIIPLAGSHPNASRSASTEDGRFNVVMGHIEELRGHGVGRSFDKPLGTQTTREHHAVIATWLAQQNTGVIGHSASEPMSTLTTIGTQQGVAAAFLTEYYGSGGQHQDVRAPLNTLSTHDRFAAARVEIAPPPLSPERLARARQVADLLREYGCWDDREFVTLIIVGVVWIVVDIGLRMLTPREAAAAHELRLPSVIELDGALRPLTKTETMRLVGNSVPKRMARLLAEANDALALFAPDRRRAAAE